MSSKNHFNGAKKKGSHTTVIPAAELLVKEANKLPQVTGIAPGYIDQRARSKMPRIVFKPIPAGLEVTVLSSSSKQTLIIYTSAPELVERLLNKKIA